MLLKYLRVPPGVNVKSKTSTISGDIMDNDYVSTILDITVDDICLTNSPLSYKSEFSVPDEVDEIIKHSVCEPFNDIIKWIARDLCAKGESPYTVKMVKSPKDGKEKLLLLPILDPLEYYMTDTGDIIAYNTEVNKKVNLDNVILFLNYSKRSLEKVMDNDRVIDKRILFKVTPEPMQMKSAEKTVKELTLAENALMRYRTQLSRIARWVNVDIGASQGDVQQEVVDSISSAINADSLSLDYASTSCEFEDGIPVIPNRRGFGKPDIQSDIPKYDIGELGDLDYLVNKLTLMFKFPATYMDFTKTLDSGVATTLRGDLRYARLCNAVRTKIEDTINQMFATSEKFAKYKITFMMAIAPSTEDSDVVSTIAEFADATQTLYGFVMGQDMQEPIERKYERLEWFKGIFLSSCSSSKIAQWFVTMQETLDAIKEYQKEHPADQQPEGGMEGDMGGGDFGGGSDFGGGGDFGGDGGLDLSTEESSSSSSDVINEDGATSVVNGTPMFDLGPGE